MARATSILRFLLQDRTQPPVHFHSGPLGQPAVCHDERCTSPRLSV